MRNISQENIAAARIPLPPISEQQRLGSILDKADAIRRKREEGIRLTEELLRSTFLEMFGDPATNPKGWKTAAVEDGLSRERPGMRCGPFGTALRKEEYVSEGVPVWGIENVQPNLFLEGGSLFISEDKYSSLSAYSVRAGDVLISRAGTVGRMCVAYPPEEHSIIGTNLIRVALDQAVIVPDYFTALFTYFADRVAGLRASSDDGAYSFMQTGVLRHVRVPLPPVEKQRAYERFVELARRNQTRRKEGLEASDLLFHSLVSRAFRGEL
jgi:type I restriction enzyme S subunit